MAKGDKGGVEGLKRRLYTRKSTPDPVVEERTPLSPSDTHAPKSWDGVRTAADGAGDPGVPTAAQALGDSAPAESLMPTTAPMTPPHHKKRLSFATKFFIGSILFFVVAIGVAAALFLGGVNTTSPQNISIDIITPSLIDGGKAAQFEFIITNRNTTDLTLADLVIDYPDGTRAADDPTKSLTHDRISIGTIKSGQQIKRTAAVVLYGQEGAAQKIVARLEYNVAGSNAVFEKQSEASFTLGSAPVSLTIDAPDKVVAGGQFAIDVTVRANTATPVDNLAVEAQYPFGFTVASVSPTAAAGGTLWRLGTLKPGASQTIHIVGSIDASDGDERVFRFLAGSNTDQTAVHVSVPFLTMPQSVTVEQPFITGSVAVEGKTGQNISVAAGKALQGTVTWQNNLSEAVSNLELTLSFSGPAVDTSSIVSQNGFYQSSNTSILWSKDNDNTLASVAPGAMGSFSFSFATLPPGAQSTLITNPTVTLNLTVRGVRASDSGAPETISSAAVAKVTLASQLAVAAESTHSTGAFQNSGPVPPRAESTTSYTITWTVKNSANTVANTTVETVLPSYVSFITAQTGSGITYDSASRTVRWSLGDLKAGVGYTTAAKVAAFQVGFTPSASQVGSAPALTGPTTVSGQDRFAQVSVQASAEVVSTRTTDGGAGVDVVQAK